MFINRNRIDFVKMFKNSKFVEHSVIRAFGLSGFRPAAWVSGSAEERFRKGSAFRSCADSLVGPALCRDAHSVSTALAARRESCCSVAKTASLSGLAGQHARTHARTHTNTHTNTHTRTHTHTQCRWLGWQDASSRMAGTVRNPLKSPSRRPQRRVRPRHRSRTAPPQRLSSIVCLFVAARWSRALG